MVKKSKRMGTVHGLAEREMDQAVEAFGESTRLLSAQQAQLSDLESYREEYRAQLQQQGESGFSAAKLNQLQAFLAKLNEAIAQQQRVVQQLRKQREQRRQQWLGTRSRAQALGKVVERYRSDEDEQDARKEQKEMDEMSQNQGKDKGFS